MSNELVIMMIFVALTEHLTELGQWLVKLGPLGLFVLALLDSAMLPLPSGPDIVLIALCTVQPAWMPLYALLATLGSTVGCTMMYLAARKAGGRALKRIGKPQRRKIETWLARRGLLPVAVGAMLPPPFPFKAMVLCSGVVGLRAGRFVTAIFLGRSVRYLAEGWLAVQFGDRGRQLVAEHGFKLVLATLLILAILAGFKFLHHRSQRSQSCSTE